MVGVVFSARVREDIVAYQVNNYSAGETRELLRGPVRGLSRVAPHLSTIYRIRRKWNKFRLMGVSSHRGHAHSGLTASMARHIRAFCRKPGGQRRGTRIVRLQTHLSSSPDVNIKVPKSTLIRWIRQLGLTRKIATRVALQQCPVKVASFWMQCQELGVNPWETVW